MSQSLHPKRKKFWLDRVISWILSANASASDKEAWNVWPPERVFTFLTLPPFMKSRTWKLLSGGDLKTQPLAGEPKETVVGCVTEILQIDRRDVVNKSACLEKRLHGFNVLSPCFELV